MLRCGQNCEFCHIESCGKNNVTSYIKLQLTSFFLHMELHGAYSYSIQPVSFQKLFKILQNGTVVTYVLFGLT